MKKKRKDDDPKKKDISILLERISSSKGGQSFYTLAVWHDPQTATKFLVAMPKID